MFIRGAATQARVLKAPASWGALGLFVALVGCRDSRATETPPDSGTSLPDANVVVPVDAGRIQEVSPPEARSVTPRVGSELGGTRVTIRGNFFIEPVSVRFGSMSATDVVVLHEGAIACVTPANDLGVVDVEVTTPGGVVTLARGFEYRRELSVLSIAPARVPSEGGVAVVIDGRGFDEETLILFDNKPLIGSRLVSDTRIEGFVPAVAPGRPEILALHRGAETRPSGLLFAYATPRPVLLAPGFGRTLGGDAQTLAGTGFDAAERAQVGAAVATNFAVERPSSIAFSAPARPAGVSDVFVANADASNTLFGGYIAYDTTVTTFGLLGVTPNRVSRAGSDILVVVGNGIPADAQVTAGGVNLPVTRLAGSNAIFVQTPASLPLGALDVVMTSLSLSTSRTLSGALTVYAPITVTEVSPTSGPVLGGTDVTVRGTGFTAGAEVRIGDVPLTDVVVVSATEITGRTVAGAHGPQDVRVRSSDAVGTLPRAFAFEEAFQLIRVIPTEGSIAGNTLVQVFGRGLSEAVDVAFGGRPGVNVRLENGSVLSTRTPTATPGFVDVIARATGNEVNFSRIFNFFNPTLITGGAYGGAVDGAVNVAVLDTGSGQPIPNVTVQLGFEADARLRNRTDVNGLATISDLDVRGPQTITIGDNDLEFVTFMELNARNLTIYASPYPASPPPDEPSQPCPTPVEPPTIRGRVFRYKSTIDEQTRPGFTTFARITYSQPGILQGNPGMPAEQADFVFGEGEEFEIVTTRVGVVAVYAILYDYNPDTLEQIPRRMGIVRQVPAAIATVTEPVNISLDIELDRDLDIRLDRPPLQLPGPTINAVFPFLNLESDGVIAFPPTAIFNDTVTLTRLPQISASQFVYMGGSFTSGATGGLQPPWSLAFLESGAPFDVGLDLGPFLGMPSNQKPKAAQVVEGGRVSWDQAGPVPDITRIAVMDQVGVMGCCCLDTNMNGVCEAPTTEPLQCGGTGVPFARWTIFGQGGLESYVMPSMPRDVLALETPRQYQYEVEQALAPRFDYREFIYNQILSPLLWTSWSLWGSTFVAKEETP